jgi:hypothetical protein
MTESNSSPYLSLGRLETFGDGVKKLFSFVTDVFVWGYSQEPRLSVTREH